MTWHVYLVGCWLLFLFVIWRLFSAARRQEKLDREYLEAWAKTLGIETDPRESNFDLRQRLLAVMRRPHV